MINRIDRALQNPALLVGLLAAGQIVAWTLAPTLTNSAPPLDVVEGYMWGREWVIATYKHPALPSWVLEMTLLATGAVGWPAYVASQLFIAATFMFVFLLGRDMIGPTRAAAGTLLLTGIAFFAWPTAEFNHNVAELPFWAGLPFALWRAVERRGIHWWVLAGALAAGGLYAKLTTVLLLATLAGWILWDDRARRSLITPGPWIALAIFALMSAPLAQWLVAHDFAPLRYAASRSARAHGDGPHVFLLSVVLNLAGIPAMLAVAGLIRPWRRSRAMGEAPPAPVDLRAQRYMIAVTAGPLLLALASALISGSNLRSAWGSSMFNLLGLLCISLLSGRVDAVGLRRLALCAAALLVVVPLGYSVAMTAAPIRRAPARVTWPQSEISGRFAAIWQRETGRPLRIVTGDSWIAGLVGITAKGMPSILTLGDPALSPWITPGRIEREGMLILWNAHTKAVPKLLQPIVDAAPPREEHFMWRKSKQGGDLAIGYVVVPPKLP